MKRFHIAVVPIGRVDEAELEAALARAVKVVHQPLELRERLPAPQGTEDRERGQHRAADLLERLGAEVVKLRPGRLVGADSPEAGAPLKPDGCIFVTDVDLYTAQTEGVLAALNRSRHCAVVSVRRLREAFWKRKANPIRQRSRMVKEILRMWARLAGLPECPDPECVASGSRSVAALDSKEERFCRSCEQRLFDGITRL